MEDKSQEHLDSHKAMSNDSNLDSVNADDLLNLIYGNLSSKEEEEIKKKIKQNPETESFYENLKAAIENTNISESQLRNMIAKGKKDLLDRLD